MWNEILEMLNADEFNETYTENGARAYARTGSALLDWSFKVPQMRGWNAKKVNELFIKAYYEDKDLALKFLFFLRDVRGGLGERSSFRKIISENPNKIEHLIPLIGEYGRYDDLLCLLDTPIKDSVIRWIHQVLKFECQCIRNNQPISLLAKWLPSINTSSEKTRCYARCLQAGMGLTEREYRKMLTRMREYLKVTEHIISRNKWSDVDYSAVATYANLKYNAAFLKHDEARRKSYLEALSRGEAKINASTAFPHDIVYKGRTKGFTKDIEAMWKALPQIAVEDTIVVADGSGSMWTSIPNSNVEALDVARALAFYFAEKLQGEFYNRYISFGAEPHLVDLRNAPTLEEKNLIASHYDDISNTNIEKVFKLILATAVKGNMKQSELPKNILIISDMEFDYGTDNTDKKMFDNIAAQYEARGYKLPRIIFWNVNSRTGAIPMLENENGVVLVSGYSVQTANMILNGETDPYQALVKTLMSERYAEIGARPELND